MAKARRSLVGKVVAITGGARGIGRATAAALIAQGSRVAIGDIDARLAAQTAEELGAGTVGLPLDVTDRESFERFLEGVEDAFGPLDVLINNAGIMPIGAFIQEDDATARTMVDINLHGVMFGAKLALNRFIPRGSGHLVNIASIAGKAGAAHVVTYCATKHAVVGLSEALRQELMGTGIDVTVVMPVGVNTELYAGLQQMRGITTPEPEDVAGAIVEALQTGRFEVYVPKRVQAIIRLSSLMPRRLVDAVGKAMGGNETVTGADHVQRADYNARLASTINRHDDAVTERETEAANDAAKEPERATA